MENEDVIREQMEDTRTSLSEKLETLEKEVASTVQGATSNVADTVEAVKETVETVKDTVQDTVATVKESVEDTISSVKETFHEGLSAVKGMFDVPGLVDAHPWLMFGGAIGVGFVLERALDKPARKSGRFVGAQPQSMPPDHYSGEEASDFARGERSRLGGLLKTFEPEINRLKGVAVGALMSWVRDTVNRAVPEQLAPKLAEVMDSVTQKLGGQPFDPSRPSSDSGREHFGNGRHRQEATPPR